MTRYVMHYVNVYIETYFEHNDMLHIPVGSNLVTATLRSIVTDDYAQYLYARMGTDTDVVYSDMHPPENTVLDVLMHDSDFIADSNAIMLQSGNSQSQLVDGIMNDVFGAPGPKITSPAAMKDDDVVVVQSMYGDIDMKQRRHTVCNCTMCSRIQLFLNMSAAQWDNIQQQSPLAYLVP